MALTLEQRKTVSSYLKQAKVESKLEMRYKKFDPYKGEILVRILTTSDTKVWIEVHTHWRGVDVFLIDKR